jgi:hypothetical protein
MTGDFRPGTKCCSSDLMREKKKSVSVGWAEARLARQILERWRGHRGVRFVGCYGFDVRPTRIVLEIGRRGW